MRSLILVVLAVILAAGEEPNATPPVAPTPDPAMAVVAEGAGLYRQRDLDALLLVAMRHARTKVFAPEGKVPQLGPADEAQIRQVLIRALTAREAFAAALAGLPERIPAGARDAIALDLLSYTADPNPNAALAGTPATASPPSDGPVLVRLPPFSITRAIEGQGRRQLTLGLALAFADAAAAQAMEEQAPIIQDAVLSALRDMGPELFTDPDHTTLKAKLTAAISGRIPAFPADGLLIPQLETGPADQPAER